MVETPGTHPGGIYQAGLQADGSFDIPGVASGSCEVRYNLLRFGKDDIPYPAQSARCIGGSV
jgi:hypothetical protein